MCQYYPIKLGGSVAPEIALKCNINAAILRILPFWNTRGPSDAIAKCYDRGDLSMSLMFHVDFLCELMKCWRPCLIHASVIRQSVKNRCQNKQIKGDTNIFQFHLLARSAAVICRHCQLSPNSDKIMKEGLSRTLMQSLLMLMNVRHWCKVTEGVKYSAVSQLCKVFPGILTRRSCAHPSWWSPSSNPNMCTFSLLFHPPNKRFLNSFQHGCLELRQGGFFVCFFVLFCLFSKILV